MTVELDHTIVAAHDNEASAVFLSDILGLPRPTQLGHFVAVEVGNGVTLDFMSTDEAVTSQHYAFAVSEAEFDEAFERIQARGLDYWADPSRSRPGQIRDHAGGRGLYFEDPSGHLMEILTRPE
jgi:catechol 2,3-dioxygenase-like lactoylglutathione lyase family enzyme